jgi:hypothetical protein
MNSRTLRLVLWAILAIVFSTRADAGVLSYNAGVGGTFDPSTPSTFTFTNFGVGGLSAGVNYDAARVVVRWGGTAPLQAGGISVTSISVSNPSMSVGTLSIPAGTGSAVNKYSSFLSISPVVTTTNLGLTSLTVTIPTLTAVDGFFLEFGLQFTDNIGDPLGGNTNFTAFQEARVLNSSAVPEPGTWGLGGFISLAAAVAYRRRRTASAS